MRSRFDRLMGVPSASEFGTCAFNFKICYNYQVENILSKMRNTEFLGYRASD
ncbi:MAG: hypothetical protein ACLSFZ_12645 [Frisingicoccus sp.]